MTEAPTFEDGFVAIYKVENGARPGEKPLEQLARVFTLPFHRRTIGIQRAYLAMQANVRVDLLLRVPYRAEVSTLDIAAPVPDGGQYKIKAIQRPEDIMPPAMDLTLERLTVDYDIA